MLLDFKILCNVCLFFLEIVIVKTIKTTTTTTTTTINQLFVSCSAETAASLGRKVLNENDRFSTSFIQVEPVSIPVTIDT